MDSSATFVESYSATLANWREVDWAVLCLCTVQFCLAAGQLRCVFAGVWRDANAAKRFRAFRRHIFNLITAPAGYGLCTLGIVLFPHSATMLHALRSVMRVVWMWSTAYFNLCFFDMQGYGYSEILIDIAGPVIEEYELGDLPLDPFCIPCNGFSAHIHPDAKWLRNATNRIDLFAYYSVCIPFVSQILMDRGNESTVVASLLGAPEMIMTFWGMSGFLTMTAVIDQLFVAEKESVYAGSRRMRKVAKACRGASFLVLFPLQGVQNFLRNVAKSGEAGGWLAAYYKGWVENREIIYASEILLVQFFTLLSYRAPPNFDEEQYEKFINSIRLSKAEVWEKLKIGTETERNQLRRADTLVGSRTTLFGTSIANGSMLGLNNSATSKRSESDDSWEDDANFHDCPSSISASINARTMYV